ncbi:MAG: hypothetical protein V7661_07150 [Sulfitobacter sp.]
MINRLTMLVLGAALSSCAVSQATRLMVPQTSGLSCFPNGVCVEDPARIDEATALRDDALSFVQGKMGRLNAAPRLLFCTTKACSAKFGNPDVGASYFWGTNRLVISDTGWVKFVVRHEMIHHWQAEKFGAVEGAKDLPRWYIEGMAYVFSNDPRPTIPNAAADRQRAQFRAWQAAGNNWRVPPA